MTPEVKENTAFANWFRDWIAVIHEHRAKRIPANMTSADGQEHSGGAHLVGPKLSAASGRRVG
jgi:hypothetical protein